MKKIVSLLTVLAILIMACHKELSRTVREGETPQVNISVGTVDSIPDIDDGGESEEEEGGDDENNPSGNEGNGSENDSEQISETEKNEHSVYTFMGISGLYFGCSSSFTTGKETLEFTFGTSKTTNLKFTQAEFEELIAPGERIYGSLGAYTSFPERFAGKVEISFTDKHGRRWCSSRITEKKKEDNIEVSVKVDQRYGEFVIQDAHKIEIAAEKEGYRLKGKFKCTLYEVNGNAKRKIRGEFTGIVAPE